MGEVITPNSGQDAVFDQAVRAAQLIVYGEGMGGEDIIAEALRAAMAVYDADRDAYVQRQVDEARIAGFHIDETGIDLKVVMARETAAAMAMAAKVFLDAHSGAKNYVEQAVWDQPDEGGTRYVVTFNRPGGRTPHELRRAAEAERDQLQTQLERFRPATMHLWPVWRCIECGHVANYEGAEEREPERCDCPGCERSGGRWQRLYVREEQA